MGTARTPAGQLDEAGGQISLLSNPAVIYRRNCFLYKEAAFYGKLSFYIRNCFCEDRYYLISCLPIIYRGFYGDTFIELLLRRCFCGDTFAGKVCGMEKCLWNRVCILWSLALKPLHFVASAWRKIRGRKKVKKR